MCQWRAGRVPAADTTHRSDPIHMKTMEAGEEHLGERPGLAAVEQDVEHEAVVLSPVTGLSNPQFFIPSHGSQTRNPRSKLRNCSTASQPCVGPLKLLPSPTKSRGVALWACFVFSRKRKHPGALPLLLLLFRAPGRGADALTKNITPSVNTSQQVCGPLSSF
jgi:hypothetical protein